MGINSEHWDMYESPLGPLTITAGPAGLRGVRFTGGEMRLEQAGRTTLPEVASQLDRYFEGELRAFDLQLDLRGGPLELAVWGLLGEIPYGETTTYGELASRIEPGAFPADVEDYLRAAVPLAA
jgi:methylated-DNA-[protein]-cysteine S-methyltransferase